ncbi:cAMP-specific 3',5'-cyclic phosphodiesterase-like [Drosophila novamexicana]|uniref:cAMP-specific 3',5'-cyclic phosphodiesterase-like n=1 Tax=Drosophila novamexicana TaxID=47314 RepID=UPI0011E5C3E8|nr:cAMP-specific 3',5'-cyclic phosphodiesterase-like [Drosophila novamexicana]
MRLAKLTQSLTLKNATQKCTDPSHAKRHGSSSSNGAGQSIGSGANVNGLAATATAARSSSSSGGSGTGTGSGSGSGSGNTNSSKRKSKPRTKCFGGTTLINDVDEDLEQQLTAADIAAASLASGLVARRAEPETLSDASVSPTVVVLQLSSTVTASTAPSLTLPEATSLTTVTTAVAPTATLLATTTSVSSASPSPSAVYTLGNSSPIKGLEEPLPPITIAGGGYCGSCESVHHSSGTSSSATAGGSAQPEYGGASTPSPRIKLKFRKPHKSCWSRIVLTPIGSTGGGGGGGSSSATLLPTTKMQAEQGSIGDLQKYHSRYLKNRRHTLANVR